MGRFRLFHTAPDCNGRSHTLTKPENVFGGVVMKIWYVRDLEPIPGDPGSPRLLRAGMLATRLAALGHQTTWFTSSFNHYSKRQRNAGLLQANENLSIEVLPAPGYVRNISIRRLHHNRRFAQEFLRRAAAANELPDVLVADLPTPEAAAAAVAFAQEKQIPTVVTIRDLWPDFFAHFVPQPLRPVARLPIWYLDRQTRYTCRNATSLVGISDQYLEWGRKKGGRPRLAQDRVFPLGYLRPHLPKSYDSDRTLRGLGINPDRHIISFVGSWGATYDLPLVLETARLLAHRTDINFVLVGNSAERPSLAREFGELNNVHVLGWRGQHEIAALLSKTAIGLLPYAQNAPQGLPNKIYEYMAYGAFQLATLSGEAENFFREMGTGRCVPNINPSHFAKAIEEALADRRVIEGRDERIAIFKTYFDANKIYRDIAAHIVGVAQRFRSHGSCPSFGTSVPHRLGAGSFPDYQATLIEKACEGPHLR